MHYTYLIIDLCTVALPFAFSFWPATPFYRQWPALFPAVFINTLFYVVWDAAFTHIGVWGFNRQYLTGFYILNLPLEEVLFFITIPYACLFTFFSFSLIVKNKSRYLGIENILTPLIIFSLSIVAAIEYRKLYTLTGFGFTAIMLAVAKYVFKVKWLWLFYTVYIVIQLPFFIVNGLLTGHWLAAPVVWYNNSENLAIRLTTIPVEDIFYGMGLLLMNTVLFQCRSKKRKSVSLPFTT